jgi:hypothetical protein
MDRRAFVKAGAWLTAAGWLLPSLVDALERPGTIVLVDAALPASRAFANAAVRRALPLAEIGADAGVLWHATLAPHFARTNASAIGVLRASDGFVLRQLAASANCRVRDAAMPRAAGALATVALVIDRQTAPGVNG